MDKRTTDAACRQFPSDSSRVEPEPTPTLLPPDPRLIYMSFVHNAEGWHCRFHLSDLRKTPISRQFVFQSAEKIHEAARRGYGLISVESRDDLDEAITKGRGGIWLRLSEDQCSALAAPKPAKPARN